ncbi:MAG: hypothetical protein OEM02_15825, partial [Desulfobulbaceae bacterium]|nr:hypothetical protein [Desulfobulbaceae bacterium]
GSDLDDIITQHEGPYHIQLDKLRQQTSSCPLESAFPSDFFAHLMTRTQNIRNSFQDVTHTVFQTLNNIQRDPKKNRQTVSNFIKNNPEQFKTQMLEVLGKKCPSLPEHYKQIVLKEYLISFPDCMPDSFFNQISSSYSAAYEAIKGDIAEHVKKAHISALLAEGIAPNKFVRKFRDFHWSLIVGNKDTFILGDIGTVPQYGPELVFKTTISPLDDLKQVFLPISDSHLIMGKINQKLPTPNFDQINKASASLSKHYFISTKNREKETKLSGIISSTFAPYTKNEISELEKNLIEMKNQF